jgi:ubiquinone/menaquinone biosynthesis C-methylase UbiE
MLRETARVLRPDGTLVIGLIDRESPLGQDYVSHQAENVFYRAAKFFSAAEVARLLAQTGFRELTWLQTLSSPIAGMREPGPAAEGTGRGAFLAVRAWRGGD